MKTVRINLIKRSEVRYQGIVNPKFLVIALSSAVVAAMLLVMVVRGVQFTYRKKIVRDALQHWGRIEPRYEAVKDVRKAMARQNKILDELRSRRDKAATWDDFLLMLRKTVPQNIQFNRLSVASSIATGDDAVSRFSVTGASQGESAQASVISWQKALKQGDVYGKYFDTLELGYLRLSGRGNDAVSQRSFELKGGRQGEGPSDEKGGR